MYSKEIQLLTRRVFLLVLLAVHHLLMVNLVLKTIQHTHYFPVQRLCIAESAFNVSDNLQFFIHDNVIRSTSGFMIFYNAIPMTGVLKIVAYNNTEGLLQEAKAL